MSASDETLASPIRPVFTAAADAAEAPGVLQLIKKLRLQRHPEGGYYVETDRDALRVPNPFLRDANHFNAQKPWLNGANGANGANGHDNDSTRSASTTIFYLLTKANPQGVFHRNKARTVHTLHCGRGRYVVIHAEERGEAAKARIETFVVGPDVLRGERLQWLVEGGAWKASFLLPDVEGSSESGGLLISEVR